jgi:hypothetical protein
MRSTYRHSSEVPVHGTRGEQSTVKSIYASTGKTFEGWS